MTETHRGRLFVTWHNCILDGRNHAITDESFAHGRTEGTGHYRAVCGHLACPGSSFEPERRRCDDCVCYLRARRRTRSTEERFGDRRVRRATWWTRPRT